MTKNLLSPYKKSGLSLKNKVVMAPMTRSRAINNIPNDLMATYYQQRAGAGLIITEGTSPSPNGLGYARIPGIYSQEQVEGWRKTTEAVHEKGAKIFVQLMHTGRVSHPLNMPQGAKILAPSAVVAKGDMWTDQEGMQPQPAPRAFTLTELRETIQEFVNAAKNAVKAGFDGVELHAANGYLLEQFLNPATNQRTDEYGGSVENRARFILEIAAAVTEAIGKEKVGIRLSPYGVFNDMPHYNEIDQTYQYLTKELDKLGLTYIHLINFTTMDDPTKLQKLVKDIRNSFKNTLILCGGYTQERAEKDLQNNQADLIAFGRPFISNPDLVERFETGAELVQPDPNTFYSADEKGYIDYPTLQEQEA